MAGLLSRRHFFASAAGLGFSAELALGCPIRHRHCVPCPPPNPQPQPQLWPDPDSGLRTRPNVLHLSGPQLESLRRGVGVMKSLPATDRRSWTFQAAIHGTTASTSEPLFNQCEHGTLHFLPWHRGFLHFFERILRWAAADPSLTLPFWDWTASPVLPEAFRNPADLSNPLFEAKRKANDGSAIPSVVVVDSLEIAMEQTAFPASGPDGFSGDLEDSPHGAVHTEVGGTGGLMSKVPTAAGDPIFWLHHANIDRLWNVWLLKGGGRTNPADPAYLDKAYTFADETGGTATVRVRDIMDSARLGYRYEGVANPKAYFVAGDVKAPPTRVAATSAPVDAADANLEKVEAKPLGFEEKRVKLATVKEARPALMQAIPGRTVVKQGAPKVTVAVEGLSADVAPDFVYSVYVNLPEGERSDAVLKSHFVGTINFFGKTQADKKGGGGHDHGAGKEFTATFDASRVLSTLQQGGKLDPDALTVTILPTASVPPGTTAQQVQTKAAATAKEAKVSFKRVSIRVAGSP